MRKIKLSEAKARLSELVDDVERGETLVLTRHGRDVARIVPAVAQRAEAVRQAKDRIEKLRKRMKGLTLDDILTGRHEGHKY